MTLWSLPRGDRPYKIGGPVQPESGIASIVDVSPPARHQCTLDPPTRLMPRPLITAPLTRPGPNDTARPTASRVPSRLAVQQVGPPLPVRLESTTCCPVPT